MMTKSTWVVSGASLLMFAMVVPRARAGEEPRTTLVTDANVLASLGFPAGARNVYVIPEQLDQPLTAVGKPQDYFGSSVSGFSTYLGQVFKPSATGGASAFYWASAFNAGDIMWSGDGDRRFEAQLADIPDGARLQALRWWAADTHPITDMLFAVHKICQPHLTAGPAVITVLASQSTLGSIGDQSGDMAINVPIDTKTCSYRVLVTFGVPGNDHVLYKVRAQWVRQVSTAPVTARFLDVPPNHPFFRFVEALAASGITGGCSANQYCPDSPVTRGQMAVFLATALGLSWGGL